jgi:hypothetical protein
MLARDEKNNNKDVDAMGPVISFSTSGKGKK